jgi:hypothetical protein
MAKLSEDELAAIYQALAMNVREYHQVVEVSHVLPGGRTGLMVALDILASIYWRHGTYRQWSSTPKHDNTGGCFDYLACYLAIPRESPGLLTAQDADG